MAFSVQMPALGESVTEGTVTRWLKQEGDRVEVDEPLLEVSTDKVDTEIPSPAAGVLQRIVAAEDDTVEVGGELAVIGDGDGFGGDSGGSDADAASESGASDDGQATGSTPEAPSESAEASAEETPEPEPEPAAAPSDSADSGSSGSSGGGQPVTMPELGESVTEGTVTRWLKQVGDTVEVDEPLLEISTDKVDTEIPSPLAGTLLEITVGEDETVEVGAQLATIGDASAAQQEPAQQEPAQQEPAQQEPAQQEPAQEKPAQQEQPAEKAPEPAAEQAPENAPSAEKEHEPAAAEPAPQDEPRQAPAATSNGDGGGEGGGSDRLPYVTPLVRKLAAEHGVDLDSLQGSGVGGRIRKQDVLAAAEKAAPAAAAEEPAAPAAAQPVAAQPAAAQPAGGAPRTPAAVPQRAEGAPQPGTTVKMPRLRQVIAQRMRESLAVSAQLTTVQEVDVTRVARLRARAKAEFEAREGVKLTYLPFFAKATVEALRAFPQVNASINDETKEVTYHGAVHLAIAVDTPRGLLVPVIKNAEELNIAGLARKIADVAARTRAGKIGPDELSGGTFTITNIGSAGALFDTPIINQPQVAILGTGAIVKEPKVVAGADGEDVIAVRSVCYLPLTYDHRLVDGADAGRFVSAVKARLEEGAFESDLGL
ncbi:MAG: 2-oxoglutarate dehydrogenase, E2 component, dihydrolipoamide succinyltransferase [Pseudonocardia sp.]|uniref:2-oxoglutarate dehydrogenase, E2 component, dihydrolipoamide succinyltransferase n=1 Tax=unclassified Pseudonocardia TaxID=2619320 RepID=UPI000868FD39|nr:MULTISPECIES: 2-oxoglutarate dehydrogenase, E2 component, dihydrolipoamide succinyltransferase [unclassified Pseudonocardia]MBN9110505.1 2-oxoglutarate dehydrogenase, E2 component, dihydrolipoamide succinyltransferase [Pseudonocardia sp.]ODU14634.1 MAG: 2-oxoglutarate dehydrogenase, E2 component, dihydrolipoamide succinyltransferase [Pseudonocardia sp. SCN 72-51]ODU99397.1 MAG: 2-oxoglutarate dehydrogenase, E2 component, dihydrolipoamide succinyltransferase [Pseudonocardia sp. SCN 73-27]